MYLNQFSVRIPEGQETSGGYVEMRHGQQYTLMLRNDRNARCDAQVEVDGKHVGTWRINAHSNIVLERPVHDEARFTFYRLGTAEAEQAQLNGNDPNLGLVRVTFTPERPRPIYSPPHPVQPQPWWPYQPPTPWWTVNTASATVTYRSALAEEGTVKNLTGGYAANSGVSAGGTGLSGHSEQQFYNVAQLDYDYSQETSIHLRLVCRETAGDGPRPLVSASNPIPPRIG